MGAQRFVWKSELPVPAKALWDWHSRPGAFQRLNPPFDPVELVEEVGGIEPGARKTVKMRLGPVPVEWVALHTAWDQGKWFKDEQEKGPFKSWVHTHTFEDLGGGRSALRDEVEYALPMGPLGAAFGGGFAEKKLRTTFSYRHEVTRLDLGRWAKFRDLPRLKIAITGASGLVASQLIPFLTTQGHAVLKVRRNGEQVDPASLEGADAVVHLGGANVGDGRWTDERKKLLLSSRIDFTRSIVEAMAKLSKKPKVFVSASATGIYGERGDEVLTDASAPGAVGETEAAFLVKICTGWEREAKAAEAFTRVVMPRIGVVLTAQGGALAKLLPPFKAGVGGPVGDGKQWMTWIGMEDLLGVLHEAIFNEALSGPINTCSPNPVTNAELSETLGKVLKRPAFTRVPKIALEAGFGEMARGTLLASQRATPTALLDKGYSFAHPSLESALRFTLGR